MAMIITVRRLWATWSWEEEGIQTDRSGKERGSLLGSVPAVSHRDQAWGSEILRDPPPVRRGFRPGPAPRAAQGERSLEGWRPHTPGPEPGTQQPGQPPGGQRERGLFVSQEESGHGNEL